MTPAAREGNQERKGAQNGKIPFFSRLQVKYAMSYLAILAVVLVLLNTYPLIASQNLLFSSKRDALKSQTAVMASALMELESLNADQVTRVMNMLDRSGLSRTIVTDPSGLILYDSLDHPVQEDGQEEESSTQQGSSEGYQYALFQEVVQALEGNDVVYSYYRGGCFYSTAACPIVYRGMIIGAIYLTESDSTQGALLMNLQQNLRSISLVLVGIALTLPISSAAICSVLGLTGLAGGAAVAGCCANMVGFAVLSFRENRWGGLVSQGIGTSMLQMPNIVKNPRIWLPAILTSAVTGPLATCFFKLEMNGDPINSGMGTCGLCGQLGVWTGWVNPSDAALANGAAAMAPTAFDWVGLILISFVLPAVLTWAFGLFFRKIGWIKPGDLTLPQ